MAYELRSLIAQTHLADGGFYRGKLDGEWGPLSKAAANAWNYADIEKEIPIAAEVKAAPTPYELARRHIGEKEIPGKKNNPLIVRWLRIAASWVSDDETAWCSAFVNAMAQESGYESSGKLNARSWLDCGAEIHAAVVRPGDVAVFWRVSKTSWQGHVGFVVSRDAATKSLKVLGGNQADAVTIATYSESQLLGFRRLRTLEELQGNTSQHV